MSDGMETTAKMFGLSTLVCPNCNLILSDSETTAMQASGPVPLCSSCQALVSATTKKETEEYDPINHPKHYNSHPSGVACIEIVRYMTYNRGVAVAYIWRAHEKGTEIEDLKKAVWHLNDEIARLEGENK